MQLRSRRALILLLSTVLVFCVYFGNWTCLKPLGLRTANRFSNKSHRHSKIGKDGFEDLLKCAPFSKPPTNVTMQGKTCEQLMNEKIVIAGAISSNHFEEAKDMIASVQYFYPNLHIIIYDLGLAQSDLEMLGTYCNVHTRQFNFSKFPDFIEKKLFICAWKPLIALELSNEFEFIFYYDSSIRLMKPVIDIALPLMKHVSFVPGSTCPYKTAWDISSVRTTHPNMLRYLKIKQSREELDVFGLVEGGAWAMRVNDVSMSKIIKPWVDCALHKQCIAPAGARKICNPVRKTDPKGRYRGCHRFDQSALNMILIREFGFDVWDSFHLNETAKAVEVERHPTNYYRVKICSKLLH